MAVSRIKLLIWSITLAMIVGCVPSLATPTPIPPLDPNTINVFIAQTAEAASAQTAAALPTFTSTATFTHTPRNTYTPEPTLTPIQTFILPSPTPVFRPQYYRVKHDHQLAIFDFKSRTFDGNSDGLRAQAPEIVALSVLPKEASGTARANMSGAWEIFIDSLNNNDNGKLRYLKSGGTALFNTAGFPQLESLTMGGNIITLDSVQGEWGKVHTMAHGSPPNAAEVNYVTRPDLIQKFVVVGWKKSSKTTILVNPPKGDIYWPLVANRPVWVQMDRLEPFPILPLVVTVNTDMYIQSTPGPEIEQTRFQLSPEQTVKVIAYQPSGANVWGRLQSGGWIPLLFNRKYLTSWSMATVPPP